jgi:hypothetical protein
LSLHNWSPFSDNHLVITVLTQAGELTRSALYFLGEIDHPNQ